MTILQAFDQSVRIDAGELVGYQVAGHEYIHQKGSPGWRSSDTEMFPIIGPTNEAGFRVHVSKGNAIQDQHGLLRELDYEQLSHSNTKAVYKKKYRAATPVENSKYPEKSTARLLIWPFNFEFTKTYELSKAGLEITFGVSGDQDMPFMLGYHPAFKLHIPDPIILANDKTIGLAEVLEVGSRALEVPNCDTIVLKDKNDIQVKTEGFGNFMLWTEVPNMVCIEPISFYPYAVAQEELFEGFRYLAGDQEEFKVSIQVQ
ncbi:aldose 1-epimerase [Flavobacteriaceae bacterium 3-367]|uniref:aldose 1-epimerase n=1 Tax=Eudoraea algarum TaxID=3417568 RepID=UPI0032758749